MAQIDRFIAPHHRQKAYDTGRAFASEKPILTAFIVALLLFSFLPLVLFVSFAFSTAVFAFISAIIFSLFWIGIALFVLVPTLFVTFSIAVLVWLWAVATFLVGRWVYNVMPINARGEMAVKMPGEKQVIFHKNRDQQQQNGVEFDNVDGKSEIATEIKE